MPPPLKPDGTLDYEALGVPPPTSDGHAYDTPENPISKQIPRPVVTKWYQRGNELVAETDMGEFVNFLPTDIQLKGTNENNLPILEKM